MHLTNPMEDPFVQRMSYDLNETKELLNERQRYIESLESENKILHEKYNQLLKDNMEMAERYLSIIVKIKAIESYRQP